MTPLQFAHTLQMMDSLFPVGGFAYSDGLESAAASGDVRDGKSLAAWMDHVLHAVIVPCDGLALLKVARATETQDWDAVRFIDAELAALKPAAAVRTSSVSVGKRLLAMYTSILRGQELVPVIETLPHCHAPVAYGMAFSHLGLRPRDSLLAYGYGRLAGIVSAALRLLPVGQQQGQALLTRALDDLPAAVQTILFNESESLRSFSPLMDIQQMKHRFVYSRLFRS
jgi:urease accessory protein